MSKSSGRSPANGNAVRRPVRTRTSRSCKRTLSERKPVVVVRRPRDPIEQTIEEVIARSLLESQDEWLRKPDTLRQPGMRQKRQPEKRKTTTTLAVQSLVAESACVNSQSTTNSATATQSTAAVNLPESAVCTGVTSVKTSSSSKLANGRVHGSGLTNGKSHGPPQRASPIRVVNRQPVSAAAGSTTKRPSVVPSDVTPTPTTSDKLTGLLAKKRKRTEESSSPVRTPASALPPQKVPASQHKNASVIKKRKLEALMHKREENSVWSWRGKSFIKTVYSKAEKRNMERTCYNAIRHEEGEVIKVGDCVLLRSPKGQQPHVGKVAAFWADERGDMMMTIFWFWRPEEVDANIRPSHGAMEVYVSSLRDENFVSCIDEKCFVVTAHQYARFMAISKADDVLYRRPKRPFVPSINSPINSLLPDAEIDPEIVYFANKGFDGKSNRFWDYYFKGGKLRKLYHD